MQHLVCERIITPCTMQFFDIGTNESHNIINHFVTGILIDNIVRQQRGKIQKRLQVIIDPILPDKIVQVPFGVDKINNLYPVKLRNHFKLLTL